MPNVAHGPPEMREELVWSPADLGALAREDGLFHQADRFAVAEDIGVIPLLYVRNMLVVKPWVHGWWEYGKTWSSFADLIVDDVAEGSEKQRR